LPGIAILLMGLVVLLSNGPNPKIMLAIDFRGPFLHYFLDKQKVVKELAPCIIFFTPFFKGLSLSNYI